MNTLENFLSKNPPLLPSTVYHGKQHWDNVARNGNYLASFYSDADKVVIQHFAYLHDRFRLNDGLDPLHGERAAHVIANSLDLLNLTISQFAQLVYACAYHNNSNHIMPLTRTIAICWDADRLDLTRVSTMPITRKLYTYKAKSLIQEHNTIPKLDDYLESLKNPLYLEDAYVDFTDYRN